MPAAPDLGADLRRQLVPVRLVRLLAVQVCLERTTHAREISQTQLPVDFLNHAQRVRHQVLIANVHDLGRIQLGPLLRKTIVHTEQGVVDVLVQLLVPGHLTTLGGIERLPQPLRRRKQGVRIPRDVNELSAWEQLGQQRDPPRMGR